MTSRNQQFRDEIVDDSARRPVIATSGNGWVTILGLLASIGVFAKAFLVSDGIIWDEQPTFDNHACGGCELSFCTITRPNVHKRKLL